MTIQFDEPPIERVRQEPKLRALTVERVENVTPGMLRLTLAGDALADFSSLGFDDHVKLLLPGGERRDYTPRRFQRLGGGGRLVIDFALHEAGPATRWALAARPGDRIDVGGPKGSAVIAPDCRDWLLVGDETALPAIGRFIEEARAGTRITALVAVTGAAEEQRFETEAELRMLWAHRADAADPSPLLARLDEITLRPGTFAWIAAEAGVARAARGALLERGHPLPWMKAGGYWIKGKADAHETIR